MDKYGVVTFSVGDEVTDSKLGKGSVIAITTDNKNPTVAAKFASGEMNLYTIDGVSKDGRATLLERVHSL